MDISFDSQNNLLFPSNNKNECNDSFNIEEENVLYLVSLSIITNTTLIFPFVSGMKILWIIIKEEEICFLMIYPIH